jgi:hypothetical protein
MMTMKRADYISVPAKFGLQNACAIIAQAYPDAGEIPALGLSGATSASARRSDTIPEPLTDLSAC